ncbi:MAG TPA: rRNA maturation RNase YbeY [Methyloceanibacter sp.]|jgi:probable rRNA maturation factor|nr:rRNA maturation RNase YbeY [Methyloceanibacter sp.]
MADGGPSRSSENSSLEIEIVRHSVLWDGIGVSDDALSRAPRAAFAASSPTGDEPCEVTLVLTDDDEMRELNRTWRGKDAATNVLSFPAGGPFGETHGEPAPLGDIVLAGETVIEEAKLKGIPVADHATHLVVHGMLHLLGHDHERDADAERMETLETKILAGLGIADPYAEDAKSETTVAMP